MPECSVSIVVPSHNRQGLLSRLFEALEEQVPGTPPFEVIVVADGCRDGTVSFCHSYRGSFPVRLAETPGCGPAIARNRGVELAQAPLLLFLDDDVLPARELVRAHVNAHLDGPAVAVIGPYPPAPHASRDLFRLRIRSYWLGHFAAVARPDHRFGFRDLLTGNLSVPRALWIEMGGLDPDFARAREDHEFGVRLLEKGVAIRFCPQAFAWHHEHVTSSLKGAFRRAREEGRSDALMALKHPKLRSALPVSRAAMKPRGRIARTILLGRKGSGSDVLCGLGAPLLRVVEWLGLRRTYTRWFNRLHSLAYHRGACEALGGHWWKIFPSEEGACPPQEFDLDAGLDRVEQDLDRLRPQSARITSGGREIALLGRSPGHEPLAGRHLRRALFESADPARLIASLERDGRNLRAPRIPPCGQAFFRKQGFDAFLWQNAQQWGNLSSEQSR